MSDLQAKREYRGIDAARLVMALLVVYIHFPFIPQAAGFASFFAKEVVASVAVPFFFMASGFFLFKRAESEINIARLWKTEARVFFLYLFWSLLYLPNVFASKISGGEVFSAKMFFKTLLSTAYKFFTSYSYVHLWYLSVLLLALPAVFFVCRKLTKRAAFIFGAAVFAFSLCFGNYGIFLHQLPFFDKALSLYASLPSVITNTLAFGIPYVAFGCAAAKSETGCSQKKLALSAFAALLAVTAEASIFRYVFMLESSIRNYLFLPLAVFLIFRIAENGSPTEKINTALCRRYSQFIYFAQLLLPSALYNLVAARTGITIGIFFRYLIAVAFSVLLSYIFSILESNAHFQRIGKLH